MKRALLDIGEVVEVLTPVGLLYAQAVNRHERPPKFGTLVRIPSKVFVARPSSFDERSIAVFSPLDVALENTYPSVTFQSIGKFPVPTEWQELPTFREKIEGSDKWTIWDGQHRRPANERDDLQEYPRLLMGPPYAVVYWALEAAGLNPDHAELEAWFGIQQDETTNNETHYLLFDTPKAAAAAARRVAARGDVRSTESDSQWLVAIRSRRGEFQQAELTSLANEFGGEFDGSERPV